MSGYTFEFVNLINPPKPSNLGGGLPGTQPKGGLIGGGGGSNGSSGMTGSQERATDRKVLRKGNGNLAFKQFRNPDDFNNIFAIEPGFFFNVGSCGSGGLAGVQYYNLWKTILNRSGTSLASMSIRTLYDKFLSACKAIYGSCLQELPNSYERFQNIAALAFPSPNSLCGKFRAANNLGDTLVPLTGGGRAPNNWFNEISNPLAGKSLRGKKLGDSLKSNNLTKQDYDIAVFNAKPMSQILQSKGASYSGNPRFVSDSSEFTRFKKLQAKSNNYNDSSFGGSTKQDALMALNRVR